MKNLVIFGGSELLLAFLEVALEQVDCDITVVSSNRHVEEDYSGQTIRSICNQKDVRLIVTNDPNEDEILVSLVKSECTAGISFGAAWPFQEHFVNNFEQGIFDFMCIDVPRYRGGAHHTWQILMKQRRFAVCLQRITGITEDFHMGEIVLRHEFEVDQKKVILPEDLFALHKQESVDLFRNIIACQFVFDNSGYNPKQNEVRYFPFLSTSAQAYINWSWGAESIVRFLNAFSSPYGGAKTFYKGKEISLLVKASLTKEMSHPFAAGLIIGLNENIIYVGTSDYIIMCELIEFNTNDLELGTRFYTPNHILEQALSTEATYTADGLELKNNEK